MEFGGRCESHWDQFCRLRDNFVGFALRNAFDRAVNFRTRKNGMNFHLDLVASVHNAHLQQMFFRRKRHRLDRVIAGLFQFFDVTTCDAIDLQTKKPKKLPQFPVGNGTFVRRTQTSNFLIKSGPKSSS